MISVCDTHGFEAGDIANACTGRVRVLLKGIDDTGDSIYVSCQEFTAHMYLMVGECAHAPGHDQVRHRR